MKKLFLMFALGGLISCSKQSSEVTDTSTKTERIQKLLVEGDQFAHAGRYDLARSRYDAALVIDPYNSETSQRIEKILQPLPRNIRKENGKVYITVFQTPGSPAPIQTAMPMASPPQEVVAGSKESADYYTIVMTEDEWDQMQKKTQKN